MISKISGPGIYECVDTNCATLTPVDYYNIYLQIVYNGSELHTVQKSGSDFGRLGIVGEGGEESVPC